MEFRQAMLDPDAAIAEYRWRFCEKFVRSIEWVLS
jgi:hypothetical protein